MASREALEQEKAYHYECIRGINTRLNALVPISRIPPELLSEVFLHTAGHRADPAGHPPPLRDWIRVTHVCRHWRETALQCTALWSRVDAPINIKWLAELLARSKDSPLSMKLSFRPVRVPGTGQFISSEDEVLLALSALHRVRTLTVDRLGKPMKTVLERLGGRAPLLESLTITGASKSAGIAKFRASISRMLSHPDSRRLHTVVTYFCCIPWRNLSCATEQVAVGSLTRLVVHGNGDPSELSVSSFKALACMPRLEELELVHVFLRLGYTSTANDIPTLPDPLTMPRLLSLRTSGESTRTTATLLTNLHTPSLSHLSVSVALEGRLEGQHDVLFAAMGQKAATLGPFRTIARLQYSLYDKFFRAYRDVFQRTADPRADSTSEWLVNHVPILEYHAWDGTDDVLLTRLCRLLPVWDAQALLLSGTFPRQGEWLELAGYMGALNELRLHSGPGVYHFTSPGKLLSLKQVAAGGGQAPFVLPSLRALTMDKVDFWKDSSGGQERSDTGIVAQLHACFVQRAQEGAEIRTLRILDSRNLWEEDLERLREVVPCLEWDGMLECSSPDSSDKVATYRWTAGQHA